MKQTVHLALVAGAVALLSGCVATGGTPSSAPSSAATVTKTVTAAPTTGKTGSGEASGPQRCGASQVEAVIAPGEGPDEYTWDTAIVLTNLGSRPCTLVGMSKLQLFTGGNGAELDIEVKHDTAAPAERVLIPPGEQAAMSVEFTTRHEDTGSCAEGATFAHVTLPGDDAPVEAWPAEREQGLPAVCGAVIISPWAAGGAPGA